MEELKDNVLDWSEMLENYINIINNETQLEDEINILKSEFLESKKPSLKETIVYFLEDELLNIPKDFSRISFDKLLAEPHVAKRSLLELLPIQRHPIPYVLVRYIEKGIPFYFFLFREKGSTETRLVGRKGLPGGHVDGADIVIDSNSNVLLKETIEIGLYRELLEEVGISKEGVKNIELVGFIKETDEKSVGADHLGLIYIVDVYSKNYKSMEDGIISGAWLKKDDINPSELESWAKLVYENLL